MKKILVSILFLNLLVCTGYSQTNKECSVMHNGTFSYNSGRDLVKVVINKEDHTEYHKGGKYYIKSTIKWVNDCEYNMTMTSITIPGFPYGPGDVMNVVINKVEGNKIYYTSTVKGESWNGVFTKLK